MIGKIISFNEEKGFGFIVDEKGVRRFFHISSIKKFIMDENTGSVIKRGDFVKFKPLSTIKGDRAESIRIIPEKEALNSISWDNQ